MQELKPKEILDTLDKIKKHGDKLYELIPNKIIDETDMWIPLLGLKSLGLKIDHAMLINSDIIMKLREMLDEQEAET